MNWVDLQYGQEPQLNIVSIQKKLIIYNNTLFIWFICKHFRFSWSIRINKEEPFVRLNVLNLMKV